MIQIGTRVNFKMLDIEKLKESGELDTRTKLGVVRGFDRDGHAFVEELPKKYPGVKVRIIAVDRLTETTI